MGLWWLLNCTSGRGILALWANCVPHLCQAKQAGNRREAGGDPLRLPPNLSRASGVGLSPNQCRPSGKPESAKKLFFLPPFPASAGTWHSFLPPSSESIALRNANKKDQISKSRVSAPPRGLVWPRMFHSPHFPSWPSKPPPHRPLFYFVPCQSPLPTFPPCALHTVSCLWGSTPAVPSASRPRPSPSCLAYSSLMAWTLRPT